MASYDVTDWMIVRGWGQYTFYDHNERNKPTYADEPVLQPYKRRRSIRIQGERQRLQGRRRG